METRPTRIRIKLVTLQKVGAIPSKTQQSRLFTGQLLEYYTVPMTGRKLKQCAYRTAKYKPCKRIHMYTIHGRNGKQPMAHWTTQATAQEHALASGAALAGARHTRRPWPFPILSALHPGGPKLSFVLRSYYLPYTPRGPRLGTCTPSTSPPCSANCQPFSGLVKEGLFRAWKIIATRADPTVLTEFIKGYARKRLHR